MIPRRVKQSVEVCNGGLFIVDITISFLMYCLLSTLRNTSYCESTNTTTTKPSMIHLRSQKIREVAENSANTEGGKIQSRRKGESHRDAFGPCSRVSTGGRTSRETNWKSKTGEKDRLKEFNPT